MDVFVSPGSKWHRPMCTGKILLFGVCLTLPSLPPIKVWISLGLLGGWRERKNEGNPGLFSVGRYWGLTVNFTTDLLQRGK